jgi:hypothetical protein
VRSHHIFNVLIDVGAWPGSVAISSNIDDSAMTCGDRRLQGNDPAWIQHVGHAHVMTRSAPPIE